MITIDNFVLQEQARCKSGLLDAFYPSKTQNPSKYLSKKGKRKGENREKVVGSGDFEYG